MIKNIIKKSVNKLGYDIIKSKYTTTQRFGLEKFILESKERELRQLCMYSHIIEKIRNIPGDIAEFGVASGTSLMSLARLNNIYNDNLHGDYSKKNVYGFDTFSGLPYLDRERDLNMNKKNQPKDMKIGGYNHEDKLDNLLRFCKENKNVKLYKGLFEDTVPNFKRENKHFSFSLIHIDCDLYKSTKFVLDNLIKRLNVGGIILFDEIFHLNYPGETEAFFEIYNSVNNEIKLKFQRIKSMPWKWYAKRSE